MRSPAVFFDRDGVVNTSPGQGYILSVKDFIIEPAFIQALKIVYQKGYKAAIITNQRCVGKGLLSADRLDEIHRHLTDHLRRHDLSLDGIYACTTADPDSPLRKPRPGLLYQAEQELGIDLKRSWMIGDRETDIQAGRAAGCRTLLVNPTPALQTEADLHLLRLNDLPETLKQCL